MDLCQPTSEIKNHIKIDYTIITLFRSITMLYGIDNIIWNIPHIQCECEECFIEYCQSHGTLL